jgi:hypothetical protein
MPDPVTVTGASAAAGWLGAASVLVAMASEGWAPTEGDELAAGLLQPMTRTASSTNALKRFTAAG